MVSHARSGGDFKTVTCTCSGTDTLLAIESTSFTANPATSLTGSFEKSCTVVDLAGNTAFTNTTFTVENDVNAPEIVRAYIDARLGADEFTLEVNEDLPEDGCRDSIDDPLFDFAEGSVMRKDGTTFISIIAILFTIPIVIHNLLSGETFIAFIFMILVVINVQI